MDRYNRPSAVSGADICRFQSDCKYKKYNYKDMQADLKAFVKKYPEIVSLESLGKTADKRKIYCLRMGNPDAKKQILVQAGIHGREWLNCQVLMKMLERYLSSYETGKYKKRTYAELFDEVAVYAIPMVNPDGVTISQYGPEKIRNKKLCKKIKKMKRQGGYGRWKANARGVDLIVLAGFMVVVPEKMIKAYRNRMINIHPSLIPSFCGTGYYGLHVHEAALKRGVKISGATVHFVDEGTDTGPIIMQKPVEVRPDDTPEVLQRRIMEQAEWQIMPKVIDLIAHDKVHVKDGRVFVEA